MSFTLKPAIREKVGLLFAIAGASGSGKTFSALCLAKGIAGPKGKIAVIDTEAGRALHYAPKPGEQASDQAGTFDFLHLDFAPPFTPERYIEAIRACEEQKADVIVIDSMSHEWNGDGGCTDIAEEIAELAATNKQTGEVNQWRLQALVAPSWKEPKLRHKRMMNHLIQTRTHLIFCLRAEEKIKFVKNDKNKTEIVPAGFQPICEKSFMFEMSASMTLNPLNPGVPDYELPKKLNEDMLKIFPKEQKITAIQGSQLKNWAEGGIERIEDKALIFTQNMMTRIEEIKSLGDLEKLTSDEKIIKYRNKLRSERPELEERLQNKINNTLSLFDATSKDTIPSWLNDAPSLEDRI